jgi:hypothetical protein
MLVENGIVTMNFKDSPIFAEVWGFTVKVSRSKLVGIQNVRSIGDTDLFWR